jgi:hypothetical protein
MPVVRIRFVAQGHAVGARAMYGVNDILHTPFEQNRGGRAYGIGLMGNRGAVGYYI